jgi:hypothetical protein
MPTTLANGSQFIAAQESDTPGLGGNVAKADVALNYRQSAGDVFRNSPYFFGRF